MNSTTRQAVYDLLKSFAQQSVKRYGPQDIEELKQAHPFHKLFLNDAGLIAAKRERSAVTRMGMFLFPRLAKSIASERYQQVILEHKMQGLIAKSTVDAIARIARELRSGQRRPNHAAELAEVLHVDDHGDQEMVSVRVIADIFIGDFERGPLFVEIKTPKPNLDIGAATKQKILTFLALLARDNPQAYVAFPYNPYPTRADYSHSLTKKIMDVRDEILIGEEFWDTIGSTGTFDQLLEVIEEVSSVLRKEREL